MPRHEHHKLKAPELMAPAGNLESAYAAFHFGADAVYLGLQQFSARADAENFSLEDLDRITAYAHAQTPPRKTFVALNTLILQAELKDVIAVLGEVADIGADAVIIQDLGVFRIAQRYFPSLRLHASTQMAVHNLEGALVLQDLGFHRVTLARELTLEEIREITAHLAIETEFFAHGALCYSYSGLCLISSLLTGRSGNRGRCAYLCRDRFRTPQDEVGRFVFSMKDLSTASLISELAQTGVASLKIEGRKKSPLYVAATVHYYRKLLDDRLAPEDRRRCEADIQTIFSRPWTTLHLQRAAYADVTDPAFVGHRGARIGQVEGIASRGNGHWLQFTTERDLERFDGVQLELPGLDKPYGFSVEQLAVCRRRGAPPQPVFHARAGARVEVQLPPHHPPIPRGGVVYVASSQSVKRTYVYEKPKPHAFRVKKDIAVTLTVSRNSILARAQCGHVSAESNLNVSLNAARQPGRTEQAARDAFARTGTTPFKVGSLTLHNPDHLFVPVSTWNEIRRRVLHELEEARRAATMRQFEEIASVEVTAAPPTSVTTALETWSVKVAHPACLRGFDEQDRHRISEVVLDIGRIDSSHFAPTLSDLAKTWGRERIRLAIPLITRAWERQELATKIALARHAGFRRWEAAHLSALRFLKPGDADEIGFDWSVYVLNRAAARQALEMGAAYFVFSPEDTRANLAAMLQEFADKAVVLLYQDTPLFISENCIRPNVLGMPGCPAPQRCGSKPVSLTSSHGDRLVAQTFRCRTVVTGEQPLCWSAFLNEMRTAGASRFRIDLSWREPHPEKALRLWRAVYAAQHIPGSHIGNFERGLL